MIGDRGVECTHGAAVVTVEVHLALIGEADVEIGHHLAAGAYCAHIAGVVHVEAGVVVARQVGLARVEVEAHRDAGIAAAVHAYAARVLRQGREIAAQSAKCTCHRLESSGAAQLGFRVLERVKCLLCCSYDWKAAKEQPK